MRSAPTPIVLMSRQAIPRHGCFPAEPASVSPDQLSLATILMMGKSWVYGEVSYTCIG